MQLTLPDCCLGDFCPGEHTQGHNKKEDGTYYSRDDLESNAYHYHNTDGSIFYRYPDGSEYYRPSNGNIRFRPPEDPPEKVEGAGTTATPASPVKDRAWRPWYDWPPQLNIFVKTNGPSVTIGDNSGSTITFEPVGSNADLEITPARDHIPSGKVHLEKACSQASKGVTFEVQEWVRGQALADIASRGED